MKTLADIPAKEWKNYVGCWCRVDKEMGILAFMDTKHENDAWAQLFIVEDLSILIVPERDFKAIILHPEYEHAWTTDGKPKEKEKK